MVERSITKGDVEGVLENPDATWTHQRNGSRAFRGRTSGGRPLIVWVVENAASREPLIVKSAAWISKEFLR